MNMKTEPARIISLLTALATAIIGLLVAFGIDVSTETQNAIIAVIGAAVPVIFLAGELIRANVYSPKSVEKIADQQYAAGVPPTTPQPDVPAPAA